MIKKGFMNKIYFSFLFCILISCTIHAQKIAVKSNLLYDATGTVNLGGEYAINKMLSASLSFNYNGWALTEPQMWKHMLVQPEVRYWLRESFNEHYVGAHLIYAMFDVERLSVPLFGFTRQKLYTDGTAYGGGISYGYHLYLAPRMNLEFSLGVGFLNLKYKKSAYSDYPPPIGPESNAGKAAPDLSAYPFLTRSYVGPTQLGITFVYILK